MESMAQSPWTVSTETLGKKLFQNTLTKQFNYNLSKHGHKVKPVTEEDVVKFVRIRGQGEGWRGIISSWDIWGIKQCSASSVSWNSCKEGKCSRKHCKSDLQTKKYKRDSGRHKERKSWDGNAEVNSMWTGPGHFPHLGRSLTGPGQSRDISEMEEETQDILKLDVKVLWLFGKNIPPGRPKILLHYSGNQKHPMSFRSTYKSPMVTRENSRNCVANTGHDKCGGPGALGSLENLRVYR